MSLKTHSAAIIVQNQKTSQKPFLTKTFHSASHSYTLETSVTKSIAIHSGLDLGRQKRRFGFGLKLNIN